MLLRALVVLVLLSIAPHVSAEVKFNTVEEYLEYSKTSGKTPNRLINESSPYLLQHAYNPVQWYAWGEEAFERARKEDKPLFLSIGYSTCHWCHVMAHESFESKSIAEYLNNNFICIKVDREERPDIDNVYMAATELINGSSGWPMTIVMNHDLEPFFAGTYFPPETVNGHRGLKQLLIEVKRLWTEERSRVDMVAHNVAEQIKAQSDVSGHGEKLEKSVAQMALQQISNEYDKEYGGFGAPPKFPQHGILSFLLKRAKYGGDAHARNMLGKTLTAMARGGLFDHVGGGFHRYSVDRFWQVPHFEKMLYSQALLSMAYVQFYELEKNVLYKEAAEATMDFVLREMTSPGGGFYSALDADSERPDKQGYYAEGAYYLWSEKELDQLLPEEELQFVKSYFDVQKQGNIVSDPHGEFAGLNILYVNEEFIDEKLTRQQKGLLLSVKARLLKVRQHRSRPHLDDKIITSWNGMMIAAFSEAAGILNNRKYLDAAIKAASFVREKLLNNKTLFLSRRIRGESAGIEAGLSDYAWYIKGLISLYEATEDKQWLGLAISLSKQQDGLFLDEKIGGYFDVPDQGSNLLFRSKSIYDGALPSANAIVFSNLNSLYKITKNKQWMQSADNLLSAFAGAINNDPVATAMMLGFLKVEE